MEFNLCKALKCGQTCGPVRVPMATTVEECEENSAFNGKEETGSPYM